MENKHLIIILIIFILGFLLGLFFNKFVFTGNAILDVNTSNAGDNYTYTKAICNGNKQCMDVLVNCSNGKAVGILAISKVIQNTDDWVDPRENPDSLCE